MIIVGCLVRWALLRTAHGLIDQWVVFGDPPMGQAQRRARRWGKRFDAELGLVDDDLPSLFREVLDLVDEAVDRIPNDEIERKFQQAVRDASG